MARARVVLGLSQAPEQRVPSLSQCVKIIPYANHKGACRCMLQQSGAVMRAEIQNARSAVDDAHICAASEACPAGMGAGGACSATAAQS